MADSCRAVIDYASGISLEQFINDQLRQDAIERRFEVIGEAAGRVSDALQQQPPKSIGRPGEASET